MFINMKPKSSISKGKRFENFIAQQIEGEGLGKARREIGSGSGKRKGDIFTNLPFLIEAKNVSSIAWFKSIDQSKKQARIGNWASDKWCLVVRDSRAPEFEKVYAVIDFWEFLKLLKKERAPMVKEPDRELRWRLSRLKEAAVQVLKVLE